MWIQKLSTKYYPNSLHMILTISSVVDNLYAQPIDIVDKLAIFIEMTGIFCYDNNVFVVDYLF